jgi:hypothetical protein
LLLGSTNKGKEVENQQLLYISINLFPMIRLPRWWASAMGFHPRDVPESFDCGVKRELAEEAHTGKFADSAWMHVVQERQLLDITN